MRRIPIIVLCITLVLTACGPSVVEAPPPSTPPTVSSATTAPAGTAGIWIDVDGLDALKQQTPPTIPTVRRPGSSSDHSALSGGIDVDYEGLDELYGTPTTTTSTTPTTSTTLPATLEHGPTLLVSNDDGIDLWTPYGVIPVLEGQAIEAAFPDLVGGIVFVGWDEGSLVGIERIAGLGAAPEVLIYDPDALSMRLTQVTWVEGRRTLVYRKTIELPNDCPPRDKSDCWWGYLREYLHLYDLDNGTDRVLGVIGSFESDYIDVRFGDEWAAVTYNPYSASWACSALVPTEQLLDTWLDPWPLPTAIDPYGNEIPACYPDGPDLGWATITADGSSWMRIVGTWEFPEPWRLVRYDPKSGDRLPNAVLPEGMGASWYDLDGTHAIVGQWDTATMLLVDLDGTVTELNIEGRATLWSPPCAATPITLRSDGVGPVSLGNPDEKVMVELTAILGAPSWDSVIESAEWMGIHNGYPVEHYIRSVSWEDIGLGVIISDGVTWPDGRGGPVLIRWVYGTPGDDPSVGFLTTEGVGVGSTVEDLRAAYGDRLSVYEDEFDGWRATLPAALPGAQPPLSGIVFDLTGDPSDPATTVGYMWAGAAQAP